MVIIKLVAFGIFIANCYSYIHIIERAVTNLEDSSPVNIKSCKNCKYYIENSIPEFSRCSKFLKQKQTYYFKVNYPKSRNIDHLNYFLARTCRNNEVFCGMDAKHFERKYNDFY